MCIILFNIGSLFVNDTLIGDPLMTVPILQDKASSGNDHTSLCYELHGEADKFFSLISDGCTAVNAHYVKADINTTGFELNVVDTIGVRAVGNDGMCRNIRVGLDGCQARVNGIDIVGSYQMGGISVREYNSRVRISVPNCADSSLVMWVFCMAATTRDDVTLEIFRFPMIRFVVARGLNLNEQSHGIIGKSEYISGHVGIAIISKGYNIISIYFNGIITCIYINYEDIYWMIKFNSEVLDIKLK